jgi:hypothetical protein
MSVQSLLNIDRRVIYVILFVVLLVPLFRPLGLPLPITREAKATFDFLNSLAPGSLVLMINSTGPSTEAELYVQTVAMVRHAMAKGLKIIICALSVEAPPYNDRVFDTYAAGHKYEYGKDYLILPYKAGSETAMAAIARDIKSLFQNDARNRPLSQFPLWSQVKDIKSFGVVIDIGGGESQRWMLGHIEGPHKVPGIAAITAVILAVTQPYFSAGQLKGILSGLNGAAEYETLAKVPGVAMSGMDAQSLGHMWVVILVLLGNIAYFLQKPSAKKH